MDPRERWQTLQSHLSAARGAIAAGNSHTALEHIEAALAIDPEFLAARMLRERVVSAGAARQVASADAPRNIVTPAPVPTISAEALASFENRVKERVRLREAAVAQSAVATKQHRRLVVQLAAAAVFLTAISSTAVYDPQVLPSRTIATSARLVEPVPVDPIVGVAAADPTPPLPVEHVIARPAPTAMAVTAMVDRPPEPVREPPRSTAPAPLPPTAAVATAGANALAASAPASAPASTQTAAVSPPTPSAAASTVQAPPRSLSDATAAASVVPPSASDVVPAVLVSTPDDRALVDQALQRYRRAYNRLDARLAQAVYPAVNEGALARAFDSLESQVLLFDSCQIDLQGDYAAVTCRGTSRYVAKIGNHETHVEPRVWTFTLRKNDADWTIDSARAAR